MVLCQEIPLKYELLDSLHARCSVLCSGVSCIQLHCNWEYNAGLNISVCKMSGNWGYIIKEHPVGNELSCTNQVRYGSFKWTYYTSPWWQDTYAALVEWQLSWKNWSGLWKCTLWISCEWQMEDRLVVSLTDEVSNFQEFRYWDTHCSVNVRTEANVWTYKTNTKMMICKTEAVAFHFGLVCEVLLKVHRAPQSSSPSLQPFNLTWKAEESVISLLSSEEYNNQPKRRNFLVCVSLTADPEMRWTGARGSRYGSS